MMRCTRCLQILFVFALLLLTGLAQAQVMILVPGTEGQQGQPFREAGVTLTLVGSGWVDGGRMLPSARGAEFERGEEASTRVFYTLVMPTDRPVPVQAEWLNLYLDGVSRRHADAPVIIAAHSVAGVVARYSLVTRPRPQIAALVTIATPNVDASMIQLSDLFWQSPLGTAAPLLGQPELQQLLEIYAGISQYQPGNILRWLAHQTHPDIRYVSIIRMNDPYLEPRMQDMNSAGDLQGRSEVIASVTGHELTAEDGAVLAALFSARR
jgi:hypothetical protein